MVRNLPASSETGLQSGDHLLYIASKITHNFQPRKFVWARFVLSPSPLSCLDCKRYDPGNEMFVIQLSNFLLKASCTNVQLESLMTLPPNGMMTDLIVAGYRNGKLNVFL